jgi:PTS system nitrogen regulatory IIA component
MIERIINSDITFFDAPGNSKKRALENIANFISSKVPAIDSQELFEQLTARERLGSTAIGKGMAIPHCRISGLNESLACLVKLKQAIDFDANDEQAVDILFVLLVPENCNNEHLQLLAEIAKLMDVAEFRNQLRTAASSDDLYQTVIKYQKAA